MWLFTRYGFYSVSVHDKRQLAVRARAKKHLEQLRNRLPFLKRYEILEDRWKDYRWRLVVPRNVWLDALMTLAVEQHWSNFKKEAARFCPDKIYDEALHSVWGLMYRAGAEWDKEPARKEELANAKSALRK